MKYKLFSNSAVPQLARLFAHSADDRSCYLVKLNAGYTEADLNKCLNFQTATGAGYVFDAARAASTGICKVLAKGTNCVRSISRTKLSFSDCLLTATAEGVPTHLILGGILPMCLTVGTDVTLLYPDLNIKYDPNGYKTQISIVGFSIDLTNIWADSAEWLHGDETIAFDFSNFKAGGFVDYTGGSIVMSGDVKAATDGPGINLGTTGIIGGTAMTLDVSKSFTIECDYRQTGASDHAEFTLFRLGATLDNRFTIGFDRSYETGLCIWNNAGGGSTGVKVQRALSAFAAMKTTNNVHLKYTYDASTSRHEVYINGALVDAFIYTVLKPNTTGIFTTGGYGAQANAAYAPIINNYSVRQGV